MGDKLMKGLERFFEGVVVKPSVLHGDLWNGNIGSVEGVPSIYDPAVYYGHHEAEFGMSWCAGMISPPFLERPCWPASEFLFLNLHQNQLYWIIARNTHTPGHQNMVKHSCM